MYFYIYDSFLTEKKYAKVVSKIETRLASLGIAGKKHQLSILRSVDEMVEGILKKESPTIVVIGSDQTFCRAALPMASTDAVLGFIPTQADSLMANLLGLPVNEYACDVISARRVERISFGKINGQHFFSSLIFDANKTKLTADNKYQIIPKKVKKKRKKEDSIISDVGTAFDKYLTKFKYDSTVKEFATALLRDTEVFGDSLVPNDWKLFNVHMHNFTVHEDFVYKSFEAGLHGIFGDNGSA